MSGTPDTKCNLDTSILVNYVLSNLPGNIEDDRGSQRIIDEDSFYTVIGGKAKEEFEALCNRRYNIYSDAVEFLLSTDNEIFEYDPAGRSLRTSSNDERHFRESIQYEWFDKDKREQLSLLRRCFQEIEIYQVQLSKELIDKCYQQHNNSDLLHRLENELQIGHDCEILVDAVEISRQHSVTLLLAVDSDLTGDQSITVLRRILEDLFGDPSLLEIREPSDISP